MLNNLQIEFTKNTTRVKKIKADLIVIIAKALTFLYIQTFYLNKLKFLSVLKNVRVASVILSMTFIFFHC